MHPIQTFIQRTSDQLQMKGYLLEDKPVIAQNRGLMYAYSPRPYPLMITKVVDHFLFMDWEYDLFRQKKQMIEAYQSFNQSVNQKFKVPNWIRFTIPNMAIIAISESGFDEETLDYARRTYLVPFKGGEVGQIFLVDLSQKEVTYHKAYQRKQYGSAPLLQAQEILLPIIKKSFQDDFKPPWKEQ